MTRLQDGVSVAGSDGESGGAGGATHSTAAANMSVDGEMANNGGGGGLVTLSDAAAGLNHTNHNLYENGMTAMDPFLPNASNTDTAQRRQELVRIIAQALGDLGYSRSMALLQEESGFFYQSKAVSEFKNSVLMGQWDSVESLLGGMNLSHSSLKEALFIVKQQKYMELLASNSIKEALYVLRNELTLYCSDSTHLHRLSSLMMCTTLNDLKTQSNWAGITEGSRINVLMKLQDFISPEIMIPERRLDSLINQALELQRQKCLYHNQPTDNESLYGDHKCDRSNFPCESTRTLSQHTDEVWYIAFSPDGRYLASGSKDNTAIIWEGPEFASFKILSGHLREVACLAWSPDSSTLVTGSNDNSLKSWDVKTGACLKTYEHHTENVTSCAWLPDGLHFVSSSVDKSILLWTAKGQILHKWTGVRVTDILIPHQGQTMIAISDKRVRVYNLVTKDEIRSFVDQDSITSFSVSADGKHYLLNLSSTQEIHLWDSEGTRVLRRYTGHKAGLFVIRSCFGGYKQNFIISGSEDSNIYVWHRDQTVLLEVLKGHTGCVNSISWNPKQNMFASASDDHTIRIWTPPLNKT